MAFHPPTAGLGTGGYGVTLHVASRYGASSHMATANTDLIILDRRNSRYGAGWAIAGVEQIFNARSNAKLIVDGDGSAAIYESSGANKWVAPAGAYRDTLYLGTLNIPEIPAGTYYWRVGLDSTRIFYDTDGLQRFALTRIGRKTEYTYSNFQGGTAALAEVRIAPYNLDLRYRFHYDASARLDSITDPAGRVLRANATSAGLVSLGQPGVTSSTSLLYDSQLRLINWTSPRNHTATFTYHDAPSATGYLATSTVANIGSGAYTPAQLQGLLASTSQQNASVATDSAFLVIDGLRIEVQDIARFLVNGFNAPTTIIDPRGYRTRLTYDPGNPLLLNWISDPLGAVQRMEYDSFGRLRFARDESRPAGTAVTEYRYEDARVADKPTRIITPRDTLRDEVTFVYTSTGLLDYAVDPFGTTDFSYTAEGQVQQVTNAASEITRFHYDPRGNVDSVQIGGFRTFYGRDDYGNVDRVTPPVGSTVTTQHNQRNLPELITYFNDLYDGSQNVQINTVMSYDADGNLEMRRDGNGLERIWVSDAFGRPTEMRDELLAYEYRFYTADGLLNRITKRDNSMVATQYDAAGLPVQQESQPGGNTGLINDAVTWVHDAVGRPTRIENRSAVINRVYNLDGSLKQEASTFKWNGWAFTYDYEYNLGGARSQMKITAQTPLTVIKTYNHTRGPENFLSGMSFPDGWGATRQISFTPDVVGRRNTISFPGKTATFGFDNAGRLKTATGFSQFSYTFTYDAVGRPKTLSGTAPAHWDYDRIGQATGVTRGGVQRSYDYDKAGNRRTEIGPVSFDYALWPNTNRIRSRCSRESTPQCIWYRYNANGDLMADSIDVNPGSDVVHRRWYDGNGRLTSLRLQGDEEFRYDGLGRLITRRDGQQLGIITSYDGNNVAWKNGVFFVPGDATDDVLAYVNGPATCHFIPFSGRLLYDDCPTDWPQIGEYSGLIKETFRPAEPAGRKRRIQQLLQKPLVRCEDGTVHAGRSDWVWGRVQSLCVCWKQSDNLY